MNTPLLDLLIIGAGPTGLTAANAARQHGLSTRIVDLKPHRSTFSKALVLHARTLEAFEAMGLIEGVLAAGVPFRALNVTPGSGQTPLRVDLMGLEWGDTAYPYWLSLPQYETERCLEEQLQAQRGHVEWGVALHSLQDHGDHVEATLKHADGRLETCKTRWLLGCDGGRSLVRGAVGIPFVEKGLDETFILADALGDPGLPQDEGATVLARAGVVFVVPMPEPDRWRIIAHLKGHPLDKRVHIDAEYLNTLLHERLGINFGARDLTWTSQFVLRQAIAHKYRAGRVFIAGDAAHLHSPVGGQGLNTGAQDAFGLIWRLALARRSPPHHEALLDSYGAERQPIAQAMVDNTSLATRALTAGGELLSAARAVLARHALRSHWVQQHLGRGVGMLDLDCPHSPIVQEGPEAELGPGSRLPNPVFADGQRLHQQLSRTRHTLLLLDKMDSRAAHRLEDLGVFVLALQDDAVAESLRRTLGGATLVGVRPDRVIGFTHASAVKEPVERYADRLGVPTLAL